jgi:hypothetical protein
MSRRIEIELTSTRPDGTWTWRAAGAREPKGVLDGALLPNGSAVGDVLRAEADAEIDGLQITSVTAPKGKAAKNGLLEILPSDKPFEAVTQQLARKERSDRPRRDDRGRRDDRPRRDRDDKRPRTEGDKPRDDRQRRDRPAGGDDRRERRPRPSFTPPPELPQRPKAKRLKASRQHRSAVLAELPEEQRPIAELALQGMAAVRQRVKADNAKAKAEGRAEMPESGVLKMAEELLPRLRVAEWLDRATAAKRDIDELDLRDLRSVVASGEDPMVSRDETTRALAEELKAALATKSEREYQQWLEDIDAALSVGRVIRALKMSGQPPKAGMLFPAELGQRLTDATTASLTPDALPDRWSAVLEAAAFSPVRASVAPTALPTQVTDELRATVTRLAALLPKVATLFGVEPRTGGPTPKPLRPTRPAAKGGPTKGPKPIPPPPSAPAAPAATPADAATPVTPEASPETPNEPAAEAPADVAADTAPQAAVDTPVEPTSETAPEVADETAPAAETTTTDANATSEGATSEDATGDSA